MAYCFEVDETVEAAIRRIAHEQLSRILSCLAPGGDEPERAVHSARRSLKRLRGLLRLIRTSLDRDSHDSSVFELENDTYRQAAAELSGRRDATVMIATLETVYEDLPTDLAPAAGAVHAWLIKRHGDAYQQEDRQVFAEISETLGDADARVDTWPLQDMGWAELDDGIRCMYTQGRDEYDECCWRPSVKSLHDWRKRVKYLWHHMQLLKPIWPGPMLAIVNELDELGDVLGLDHDCAVLAQAIDEQMPTQMLDSAQRQGVIRVIYARRRRLQEQSRFLGRQVYAEKPGAFSRRLGSYWHAWQEHLPLPASAATIHFKAPVETEADVLREAESIETGRIEPQCIVDLPCQTGEGPLWHAEEEVLYWVDIPAGVLYRFDPASGENERVFERLDGAIGGFTIQQDGSLLLFMDRGAIGVWRRGQGELEILVDEIEPERDSRFNDVIADPKGRVYCGTMPTPGAGGRLYRLDLDASLTELLDEVGCSNGMGFTKTHDQLFFIDSPTKQISRFDYDPSSGDLSGRAVFVDSQQDDGVPDGMTVDEEGCVWCARWDGACLVRYSPSGELLQQIDFPVRKVSCATFGGPDLQDLYVTTAGGQDRDANGALAGSLFHLRPGVRGRAEFRSRVGLDLRSRGSQGT